MFLGELLSLPETDVMDYKDIEIRELKNKLKQLDKFVTKLAIIIAVLSVLMALSAFKEIILHFYK
jgi:hypothetical protein